MRWKVLAGVFFGAAIATKWIAVLALVAGALLVIAGEMRARRGSGSDHPLRATFRSSGWKLILCFGVAPVVVYLISYTGRVQGAFVAVPWEEGAWFRAVWDQHVFISDYFQLSRERHFYYSSPLVWLSALYPFPYHFETEGTRFGSVMAAGSPLMLWPAAGAALYMIVRLVRTRPWSPEVSLPIAGLMATYAGWLLPALMGYEHYYLYYLVPAMPFFALLLAYAIVSLGRQASRVGVSVALVASWVAFLIFMYPLLAAVRVDSAAWATRAQVYRLCPPPEGAVERFTLTQRLNEACRVGGLPFVQSGK